MTDTDIYLEELKNLEAQVGDKAKLFLNEAVKKFVLNCMKRKEAGQQETIVMCESDKAINWEVHDSVITGHVFEGNGVYIIKKFHQGDYRYLVNWRDDRKYEIIKLKESDHLLSLMKWCVQHWQLSDNVDT